MPKKTNEIAASVDETNKIRKELGLKPLKEGKEKEAPKKGSSKAPVDYWEEKEKDDKKKKRDKDDQKKRLREESNLEKPSSKDIYKSGPKIQDAVAAEPDEVTDWIAQHRQKKPKTERDRGRKEKEKDSKHTESDLVGMRIAHDHGNFEEGMDATLVLADTPLLTESGELNIDKGELENVEWKEKSRISRNNDRKKKKGGYDPTAEEEYSIGIGGLPERTVLSKYDEKPVEEKGFTIGAEHVIDAEAESKLAALTKQAQQHNLNVGVLKYQRDFLSTEEAAFQTAKFKAKKGKKKRKQVKEDEEPPVALKVFVQPEVAESDDEDPELYESLLKQRRAHQKQQTQATTQEILKKIKEEEEEDGVAESNMTITGTTQFCKSVETAVEKVESLKSETFQGASLYKTQQQVKRKQMRGVKVAKLEKEKDEDKTDLKAAIAEETVMDDDAGMAEKPLDMTVSSALEYLRSRDQLCNDQDTCRIKNKEHRPLETSTDDGEIKLEYRDKFGRVQNPKEAFRTISWKFHGKMPGDKNLQRRLQRIEREMVLRTKANKELPTQRALTAIQKAENRPHMMLGAEK